ncbi:MAG: hypothetical protein ACRCRZ_02950 [Metamycoplasmataceae bacterium]
MEKEKKYNSLVDEYRRGKSVYKTKYFKVENIDFLWEAFEQTFKKTFRIKRELAKDLKFSLKIRGIHSNYTISELDKEKYILVIKWINGEDQYWLEYKIKKTINKKKFKIKFKEILYRQQTIFGLSDTIGLFLFKRNFKKNCKIFSLGVKEFLKKIE